MDTDILIKPYLQLCLHIIENYVIINFYIVI